MCTPLISTLRRQSQVDLCELKASLVYTVITRSAKATHREAVSLKENLYCIFILKTTKSTTKITPQMTAAQL